MFNDVDGLYTYTFEAERKVSLVFTFTNYPHTLQLSHLIVVHSIVLLYFAVFGKCSSNRRIAQHVVKFLRNSNSHRLLNYRKCWSIWLRMPPCEYCRMSSTIAASFTEGWEHINWWVFNIFRQMKSPAITATLEGKNKTLYLQVRLCKTSKYVWNGSERSLTLAFCVCLSRL